MFDDLTEASIEESLTVLESLSDADRLFFDEQEEIRETIDMVEERR